MIVTRCVVPFFVIGLLAACGESGDNPSESIVRDSAGIRIVENTHPVWSEGAWSLNAEPTFSIGTLEGDAEYQLFNVRAAIRLDNGRVVIANAGSFELKYYDASGRFITAAGGSGQGPGEFGRSLTDLWPHAGDSVAAWEHAAARVSIFDADGNFGRIVNIDRSGGAIPQAIGWLHDSRLVAFHMDQPETRALGTIFRTDTRFAWYSPDGSEWTEIATLPGFEWLTSDVEIQGRTRRINGRPFFSKPPATAVRGERFYYGSADRYEIALYSPDRTLQGLIRKEEDGRELSPQIIEAYVEERMEGAPDDPATRRQWRKIFNESHWPDSVPAYRRMRVDRVDNLWVQAYPLPGNTQLQWSVFGPDGVWLTDITTPIEIQILEIGGDYILGLWRDELDVEYVRSYGLTKTEF